MAAVRDACTHVVGAYGLAAVCADEPDVIAVARKDSPIVVGMGQERRRLGIRYRRAD